MSNYEFDDNCDLCEAARITEWFHEDDICWIAECEICATPMVVWRSHGTEPPADALAHFFSIAARMSRTLAPDALVRQGCPHHGPRRGALAG